MIEIFYSKKCEHCQEAMKYMDARRLPYKAYDLSDKEGRDLRRQFREAGYKILPVIIHTKDVGLPTQDAKIYFGFKESDIEEIMKYELTRE